MLSEEPLRCDTLRIKDVHERDSILRQTGREDDHFEVLAHLFDELLAARSHQHVDFALSPLDVDGEHYISVLCRRERTVDQRFVDVEDQSLAAAHWLSLRLKQVVPT